MEKKYESIRRKKDWKRKKEENYRIERETERYSEEECESIRKKKDWKKIEKREGEGCEIERKSVTASEKAKIKDKKKDYVCVNMCDSIRKKDW